MTTTILKNEITKALSDINDKSFLEGLYTIINAHADKLAFELSDENWREIEGRKRDYKSGKLKGLTMVDVRKKVMKKLAT